MKYYHWFSRVFMAKCVLLFLVFLVFPSSSFSQTVTAVVDVDITQIWTDTGLDVASNYLVVIKTFGVYQYSGTWPPPHAYNLITPAGTGSPAQSNYPAPNMSAFAVIAKIGTSGDPFIIGDYKAFQTLESGRLYLGINDYNCGDNIGHCSAAIFYFTSTSVEQGTPPNLPQSSTLNQNYPNPFNPNTTINYSVQSPGLVKIKIYNTIGQLVRTLVDEYKVTGNYSCLWDGVDNSGIKVASGSYYYQMETNGYDSAKQMILLK